MKKLNSTEALYGFAAWLVSRKKVTIMSYKHDAAIIADLVKLFCETNDLPKITKQYPKNLIYPSFDE